MYDNTCVQDTPDNQISFSIKIGDGGRSSSIGGQDFTTAMLSNIVHALPSLLKHVPPVRVGRKSPRRGMKVNSRVNKHCETPGCDNISVSRGLCRGHGGGRRRHFAGCVKSAQSRSVGVAVAR
ncbi:hypothetical protein PHYPSEUDO_010590 [Phytophthora pseudosyringae]|uniref:Uncharacterized protein n=1 Tax=Phytophthora pseudosyringae TaxID=221518 RepID=A0A8T1VCW1_9STRA|nr:hypothetical protein PHYPSEUDO_010590 [Phytophthora pseudosyringae]